MLIRAEDMVVEERTGERNGTIINLLTTEQMHGKNRLFARIMLRPGARTPYHAHNGDFETYYILSGSGIANDNGTIAPIKAGDVLFTDNGESHSIENTGDTDMELIAVITMM